MTEVIRKLNKSLILFIAFILFLWFIPQLAEAQSASLYLSPSTGTYTTGNTFLIQLKVNSGGVAINAADGTLVFDPDKLEVVKLSKTDSVFSLWVQDPVFSNSLGTINFSGGKPSPGFTGAAGTILNITFKAKTAGTANLTFAAGSVLADDGKGTNILTHMGSGSYTLTGRVFTPLPGPSSEEEKSFHQTPSGQPPAAPVVSSPTHPKEDEWYSNNDLEFSWELPSDVTAVSLLLHKNPTANPGPISDGLIKSKKYEDIEDGIWYFHIKFKNQYGWGKITHRKILIDTTPPKTFEITVDNEGDPTNPTPTLYFKTEDEPSGIEYYEVRVGEAMTATATDLYKLPPIPAGKYLVEVKAFDKAGNLVGATTELEIASIQPPKITKTPLSVAIGEPLVIEGEAAPDLSIRAYIQKLGKEEVVFEKVRVGADGKWKLKYEKALPKGDYLVWARSEDERGALSYPTQKYALEVGLPPFLKFGKIAIDYLTTMITLIILIVGAVAVIFYTWYQISIWRKRIRKETKEVEASVNQAFRALREEVEEQIAALDKKPGLSKSEKELRDKLQEALNISEEFIGKELKDVEKELE
jgi:hypothetical protein